MTSLPVPIPAAVLAVALAAVLDALVGEPPRSVHPVSWFGRAVAPLDREWRYPRVVGVAGPALALLAALLVAGIVAGAAQVHQLIAVTVAGLVLFAATSLRMLLDEASAVVELSATDPSAARDRLPALVGRDPAALSAGEMRSAAAESVSENLADGLVAPLLAFALGALVALPVAAGAATLVKGVNTCDSMLGYRSKPVGWASARLDDLIMFLPARVSAVLLAFVAVDPVGLRRAAAWATTPPSPNSGWPMATLAAAVDSRFDKPGVYVLNPDAPLPDVDAARRGVRLVRRAGVTAFALTGVVAWL